MKRGRPTRRPDRLRVGAQGRIVLPLALRRALGVKTGDELTFDVRGGDVTLHSPRSALERLQAMGAGARMPDGSYVSEAISRDREEEARREREEEARWRREARRRRG